MFYEEVREEEEGRLIRGDFFVTEGKEYLVGFEIVEPNGNVLYQEEGEKGDFKFFAK